MNTFVAFIILFMAGVPPQVQRFPVPTIEACYEKLGVLADAVKSNFDKDHKVVIGCDIEIKKSDPS